MNLARLKVWFIRYMKFNLIGTSVFGVETLAYWLAFPTFQAWSWIVANLFGGVMQFSLTAWFNKKKRGLMFEQ